MKEIYRIKFGRWVNEEGIPCYTMYSLDATGMVDGELLTPQKITIRNNRVKVEFGELGIIHEFAFTDDVEVFKRDKIDNAKKISDRTD